jgi:hypothetical protein
MAVYLTTGLAGLASVTSTLFMKDIVTLSAAQLISLSIWVGLPWSIKMVFGTLIDGVPIFGSNRKAYIYLGNLLIVLGTLGMVDHASTQYIFNLVGEYMGLLLTGLTTTIGVVTADIVADTMAIEVVEESDPKMRDKELGMVQVLSRLFLSTGILIGAAITGPLATNLEPHIVYLLVLICPLIAVIATSIAPTQLQDTLKPVLNKPILIGGLVYGGLCILAGAFLGEYAQISVFIIAMTALLLMMKSLLKEMPENMVKSFVMAMLAIFMFRVVPGIGPAGSWFYIEQLGFSANFLGTLSIVGAVSSFVVLWLLADSITNHSIFKTMSILIFMVTLLSLPDILVYYNVHNMLGVNAKTLILADTAMIGPMGQLSMIPLGVLIARNAPRQSRAVYIALTASLMNISLVAGDLITKFLNDIFIVTRTDFSQLGYLMVTSLTLSTVLSIMGLVILRRSK